ncbi:MAG: rhomboid family intramembrane serine protease, partial [Halobacteria archaeon]|nr:rhomboid family intramembrane serine protease [Halobacteria archaeon]
PRRGESMGSQHGGVERQESGGFVDVSWNRVLGNVPFGVLGFAVLTYVFVKNGIGYYVSPDVGMGAVLNPLLYTLGIFFHAEMAHYWGNMLILVPLGVLLTWFTNNRHVLGVMFISHLLATLTRVAIYFSVGTISIGVGSSLAVFGVIAATLVRTTGIGLRNTPDGVLRGTVYVLLGLSLLALLLVPVVVGNTVVDHLGHALGFMFGGAIESLYVFREYSDESQEASTDYTLAHRR